MGFGYWETCKINQYFHKQTSFLASEQVQWLNSKNWEKWCMSQRIYFWSFTAWTIDWVMRMWGINGCLVNKKITILVKFMLNWIYLWAKELEEFGFSKTPVFLIANKIDLRKEKQRMVYKCEGISLARVKNFFLSFLTITFWLFFFLGHWSLFLHWSKCKNSTGK